MDILAYFRVFENDRAYLVPSATLFQSGFYISMNRR
jgi:hypothetical protein